MQVQFESSGSHTSGASESPGRLAKAQIAVPTLGVSDEGLVWKLAFLVSSLVMLMLLVQGPHFENHGSDSFNSFPWSSRLSSSTFRAHLSG